MSNSKIIFSITFLIFVLCTGIGLLLCSDKENDLNIKEFPPAIQRLDSIGKVGQELIKTLPGELSTLYPKIPQDVIEEVARQWISSHLYHSSQYREKSPFHKYVAHRKLGVLITWAEQLPYPWKFLINSDGIVLVEVIEYAIKPKKKSYKIRGLDGKMHISDDPFAERYNIKEYVIKGKVVEDIFDTIEEDTIYVYTRVPIPEICKSDKTKLLLNLTSDPDLYVNFKGNFVKSYEYDYLAIVKDGIIKEYPLKTIIQTADSRRKVYNTFGLDGKKYSEFKKELLDFVKREGIRP